MQCLLYFSNVYNEKDDIFYKKIFFTVKVNEVRKMLFRMALLLYSNDKCGLNQTQYSTYGIQWL
jgi:hypothetical protein